MTNKELATYWYNWGLEHHEPCCGYGSTIEGASDAKKFIENMLEKYQLWKILDCGCGYYGNWTKDLKMLPNQVYIGLDINEEVINRNNQEFPGMEFHCRDFVNEKLPRFKAIICRDVLFHLPNEFVIKALSNFKESGTTYLIATTFPQVTKNIDLPTDYIGSVEKEYGYRDINLEIEPFNLGEPLEFVDETKWTRRVAIWKIN